LPSPNLRKTSRRKHLEVDNSHILKSKNLLLKHNSLRTYDALHLSLVLDLKALKVTLVSSDQILNEAAIAESITTVNPEEEIEK